MRTLATVALLLAARQLQSQSGPVPAPLDSTITAYCAAWSEADATKRDALLARVWSAGGTYMDPTPTRVAGRSGLSAEIGRFLGANAGSHFRCGAPQTHHGYFRFAWSLRGADGKERIQGMDFGEVDAQGHIARIVGFFGPPNAPK